MSTWLRNSNSRKSLNIWADDVASEVEKEKSQKSHSASSRHRSSTTTTAVDSEGLPVPATHGERYSIASGRRKASGARFSVIRLAWQHFKRHLGTGSAPSSSSVHDESAADSMYLKKVENCDRDWVDEVVVDRVWSEEFTSTVSQSEGKGSPAKSSSNQQVSGASDYGSTTGTLLLQDRIWNLIMEIFSSRFEDEKRERHYQQVRRSSHAADRFLTRKLGGLVCQETAGSVDCLLVRSELGIGLCLHQASRAAVDRR